VKQRWVVLSLLLLVTVINFVDRQTLSILSPELKRIFHFNNTEYGFIVSAFQVGMTVAEFPMGAFMDRVGVRTGFTFAVLWWSMATAFHAFASGGFSFGLARLWMGTGECGNYSGGIKTVSQWFPPRDRTLAIGIFNGGSMIGAVIAVPLVTTIHARFGWQMAFLLPALLGVLWVLLWRWFYREPHADELHEDGTAAAPSHADLLRLPQTWGLMLCRMLVGPVVQFYLYWLPNYLHDERQMTLSAIGAFAWMPFLFGDLGSMAGGWMTRRLLLRGYSALDSRRVSLLTGALLCTASVLVVFAPTVWTAILLVSIVLFGHTFFSANMFGAITDLFPQNAMGRVTGLTGVSGGLGGILFPIVTGALIDRFSWTPPFMIAALLPLAAAACLLWGSRHGAVR
jgi:MFS transporter, ACS family, hexuronate transporter